MPNQLDFSDLAKPIAEDSPVGSDLRSSEDPLNPYRQVRDARSSARDREQRDDRGDIRGPGDVPASELWKKTSELAVRYLQKTGKDLEVAACLLEAELRIHGLAGLAAVAELTTELINRYWGRLFPAPDEDGFATTLLPLTRLNGEAILYPLQRLPVSDSAGGERLLVWQSEQAQRIEALKRDRKDELAARQIAGGAWTLERVNAAIGSTDDLFFVQLSQDLDRAKLALGKLDKAFESNVPEDARPILRRFQEGLGLVEAAARVSAGSRWEAAVLRGRTTEAPPDSVADTGSPAKPVLAAGSNAAGPGAAAGAISGREHAFQRLEEVALWFEKHEPQSLIPFEVRKVLRRGRMKPEQLFMELISEESARKYFYRDLGMVLPEQSDS